MRPAVSETRCSNCSLCGYFLTPPYSDGDTIELKSFARTRRNTKGPVGFGLNLNHFTQALACAVNEWSCDAFRLAREKCENGY